MLNYRDGSCVLPGKAPMRASAAAASLSTAAAFGSNSAVFCGGLDSQGQSSAICFAYKPESNTWFNLPPLMESVYLF